jgi:hypothetical protein
MRVLLRLTIEFPLNLLDLVWDKIDVVEDRFSGHWMNKKAKLQLKVRGDSKIVRCDEELNVKTIATAGEKTPKSTD